MSPVRTPILPSRHDAGTSVGPSDTAYIQTTLATVLSQRELWLPTVEYLPEQRWYQRWESTTDGGNFDGEVWLISWPAGISTGLHDHGGSPGAFITVDGELSEQTISDRTGSARRRTQVHRTGTTRTFGPNHLHNVGNTSKRHALSVHVYAPALTSMTRYAWTPRGPEVVSVDRAGTDW